MGAKGAQALRDFARAGGTLIFLNRAAEYGIEKLGIKAKNVVAGVPAQEFYSPGSLLNATAESAGPVDPRAAGRDRDLVGIEPGLGDGGGSRWRAIRRAESLRPVGCSARRHIAGESRADSRQRYGSGNVVLFGMRPQYRAQSYLTFKLFFNALMLN